MLDATIVCSSKGLTISRTTFVKGSFSSSGNSSSSLVMPNEDLTALTRISSIVLLSKSTLLYAIISSRVAPKSLSESASKFSISSKLEERSKSSPIALNSGVNLCTLLFSSFSVISVIVSSKKSTPKSKSPIRPAQSLFKILAVTILELVSMASSKVSPKPCNCSLEILSMPSCKPIISS